MNFSRRIISTAAAALLASMASQRVLAQDEGSSGASSSDSVPLSYVGVLGSFIAPDKKELPNKGSSAALYYGQQINDGNWFVEGQIFTQNLETGRKNFTDFYRHGLGADLVYSLNQRRSFSPFALVGAGGMYNDVVPDHGDKFSAYGNAGVGFVTRPYGTYGFRLRGEARYVYNSYSGGENEFRYSLGIELPLSPYDQPRPVTPPPPPPAEVVHTTDTVTIAEPDTDGDGVPDKFDKCPGTPKGMPVDGVGCGLSQVITLTGVTFDFNKATITPDSRKVLEEVALKVAHFADVPMELEGHTDNVGGDAYNDKLSLMRANSVRDFLVGQGVPGAHMSTKGYGKRVPVADNATEAGRALNRRVELHIAGQQAPSVPVDSNGTLLNGTTGNPGQ